MFTYMGLAGAYLCGWYVFWRLKIKHSHSRILAFHDVSDDFSLAITRTGVRRFQDIIKYIMKNGFHGKNISGCQAENDLALTFDDGWESFYTNAFPILKQYGFSSTVFIITGYVGKFSRWDYHKKKHLDWMQICELAEQGIEFACHSNSHSDLRGLDEKQLEYEIDYSKKTIEDKIGQPVKYFSYPFGRYDKSVIEIVKKAGYENAFCLRNGSGDFAIPRAGVYLYDTPYSINLKLTKNSWIEGCKDYVNNALAGGTIILKKLLPVNTIDRSQ
jgi:peptidoglycan/xylan/chitin deacetylase (PgdA/CDA1 family)